MTGRACSAENNLPDFRCRASFAKMKTKTIVLAVLFVLSSWVSSSSACICLQESAGVTQFHTADFLHPVSDDLCQDCGHSTNCCFAQNSPAIAGDVSQVWNPSELNCSGGIPTATYQSVQLHKALTSSHGNRAPPPWITQQTSVSLHRLLLI
jgi:hypothetical protein